MSTHAASVEGDREAVGETEVDGRRHRPDRGDRQAVHHRARARPAGRPHHRHGAPAVRPGRPRLEQDRVPPGRHPRPRRRRRAGRRTRTSSCTSRSSSSPATARAGDINLEGSRNVFEATVAAGARGSSTPRPSRPTASPTTLPICSPRTRRRAASSATRTPRRRPRSSASSPKRWQGRPSRPTSSGPCIVAGPDATLLIDTIPLVDLGSRLPGAVRALFDQVPVLKPVLPDPGVAVPARPPRRRGRRALRRRARPRHARGLQPRRRRRDHARRPRARAGLVLRAAAGHRRRRDRRGRRAPAVPARHGDVDRGPAPPGADGHDPGPHAHSNGHPSTTRARRCARWSSHTAPTSRP